jgi:glycerol-3-phosphate dehydrogenase
MKRSEQLRALTETPVWDLVIIGGGATGLGAALDAAVRGYKTLLLERADFGQGTSSRSTKLIHGGVRYLEQGNLKLVISALQERWFFLKNAPTLSRRLPFILPVYQRWKLCYYWAGLKLYEFLSGKRRLGETALLSREDVIRQLPAINSKNLVGGVVYLDGQFDDSGVCMALAATAAGHGATLLNYVAVQAFEYEQGKICGLEALDNRSGETLRIRTRGIINATGVFADHLMKLDDPAHRSVITASQGTHIVAGAEFFPGNHAMIIPKTSDGRVLFVVPWMGKALIGTTDTAVEQPLEAPLPTSEEIAFILQTFNHYATKPLRVEDVQACFAGLRPLVRRQGTASSANLLRDHAILCSPSGLVTITGGKWTTYRKMAEDAVNKAMKIAGLPPQKSRTKDLAVRRLPVPEDLRAAATTLLHPAYPFSEADVRHAVRNEMALTLEDVLARRTRLLYLDTAAACRVAARVAEIMREELGAPADWINEAVSQFLVQQAREEVSPDSTGADNPDHHQVTPKP